MCGKPDPAHGRRAGGVGSIVLGRYVTLALWVLLLTPASVEAQFPGVPGPSRPSVPPEVIAKNLAENVLGEDTVRRVQVLRDGQLIIIAWDTVLYRPTNTQERNREQMRGEAQLATGSIMGIMRPERIEFTMLNGAKILASGHRTREGEFTIIFAQELRG